MKTRIVHITIAAVCAATVLSGCQTTSAIDTVQTTAVGPQNDLAEGKAQFRAGNYGLAEQHYRAAVELNASDAEAWLGLAASYDELGRFDFADRAYAQAVKLVGRRPRIVNNMGYSQMLRGNRSKARKLFLEARNGLDDTTLVDANLQLLNAS